MSAVHSTERPTSWVEWVLFTLMVLLGIALISVVGSGGSSEVAMYLGIAFATSGVLCSAFSLGAEWGWVKGRKS